jgi:replication fork protection complex subunit Tof1/Swi1
MFKNGKLRLLMTLAGFERLGIEDEPDATWIIPSTISAKELRELRETILQHRNNPVMEYGDDDPLKAEDMLRRASAAKPRRVEYDDDSDGDGIVSDDIEEFLFPPGGPTNRKSTALETLKQNRRKRKTTVSGDEGERDINDEKRDGNRKAREAADLERRRKIKSNKFVRDVDEETDEELDREFFAREEMRRKGQAEKILLALNAARVVEGKKRKIAGEVDKGEEKKRKSGSLLARAEGKDSDDEGEGDDSITSSPSESTSGPFHAITPLSSPHLDTSQQQQQQQKEATSKALPSKYEVLKSREKDIPDPGFTTSRRGHVKKDINQEGDDPMHDYDDDNDNDDDDDDEGMSENPSPRAESKPLHSNPRKRGRMIVFSSSDDSDED